MENKRGDRDWIRLQVARRAAELMYFDGVKEYLRAKRKAAKQLEVTVYPNNCEIRGQIDLLAEAMEGPSRKERLLELRRQALSVMEVLQEFSPRLVGSVLTGHVKATSDIDIHVFADDHERVGDRLMQADHDVEYEIVKTKKGGEFMDFPHYYLDLPIAQVDISVYRPEDLKRPQKSSVTHRTMERATIGALRRLVTAMDGDGEDAGG
ncbi:MAG: nucleotidyltransferase domain-containing protein [Candidatus Riflebacteria bacterium]|nr:nucleotidyltransferase domain-containing protein [Candidatus Riflebacteria bacterium]